MDISSDECEDCYYDHKRQRRPKSVSVDKPSLACKMKLTAKSPPKSKIVYQLYIGGLAYWVTDHTISELLKDIGVNDVLHVKIFENNGNGQSKGFCLVVVKSATSLTQMYNKLNTKDIYGRRLIIKPVTDQNLEFFEKNAPRNCLMLTGSFKNVDARPPQQNQYQSGPPLQISGNAMGLLSTPGPGSGAVFYESRNLRQIQFHEQNLGHFHRLPRPNFGPMPMGQGHFGGPPLLQNGYRPHPPHLRMYGPSPIETYLPMGAQHHQQIQDMQRFMAPMMHHQGMGEGPMPHWNPAFLTGVIHTLQNPLQVPEIPQIPQLPVQTPMPTPTTVANKFETQQKIAKVAISEGLAYAAEGIHERALQILNFAIATIETDCATHLRDERLQLIIQSLHDTISGVRSSEEQRSRKKRKSLRQTHPRFRRIQSPFSTRSSSRSRSRDRDVGRFRERERFRCYEREYHCERSRSVSQEREQEQQRTRGQGRQQFKKIKEFDYSDSDY